MVQLDEDLHITLSKSIESIVTLNKQFLNKKIMSSFLSLIFISYKIILSACKILCIKVSMATSVLSSLLSKLVSLV